MFFGWKWKRLGNKLLLRLLLEYNCTLKALVQKARVCCKQNCSLCIQKVVLIVRNGKFLNRRFVKKNGYIKCEFGPRNLSLGNFLKETNYLLGGENFGRFFAWPSVNTIDYLVWIEGDLRLRSANFTLFYVIPA